MLRSTNEASSTTIEVIPQQVALATRMLDRLDSLHDSSADKSIPTGWFVRIR